MPFWLVLIIFAAICIVMRFLRRLSKWVDYIVYIFIFGIAICLWISEGFLEGLTLFIIGCLAARIVVGIGHRDKVKYNGMERELEPCTECNYEYFEILENNATVLAYRCMRCGQTFTMVSHHGKTYSLKPCSSCGHGKFKILEHNDTFIGYRCEHCGQDIAIPFHNE